MKSAGRHEICLSALLTSYREFSGSVLPFCLISFTATIADRAYEKGKYDFDEDKITITFEGLHSGDTLAADTDYKVSAEIPEGNETNDAGAHTATVTVNLTGAAATYYMLSNSTYETEVKILPAEQTAPAAPTIKSCSDSKIVLNEIAANDVSGNAAEYSKDGENWQNSPGFKNLSAETSYTFYARYKSSDNFNASPASEGAVFTTAEEPEQLYRCCSRQLLCQGGRMGG